MVDISSMRREAAQLTRAFRAHWTHFLAIHVAISVLVFAILTPLATALLRMAVSLSGNTALVGAFRDDDAGISSGSAYIFYLAPAPTPAPPPATPWPGAEVETARWILYE